MSLVVSDTTPLNYLILIGQIDILRRLYQNLLIPPAVMREMQHPKTPREVASWARNLPAWVEIRNPQTGIRLGIGAGEDEATALAIELGNAALLIDDRKGREAARARGIATVGTLGILDLADEAEWLNFADALDKLRKTSFHVDDSVAAALLKRSESRKSGG